MVLLAVDGGGTVDVPSAPPPPAPAPAPPPPAPPPQPAPAPAPPPPASGQTAAPTLAGAQSEPAGAPGGEPAPVAAQPSGPTTQPAPPAEKGGTAAGGTVAGSETAAGAGDETRSLESALRKKPPPGVGQMWSLLLAAIFTEPPLTHTQLQGTNDAVVDLLKRTPIIPVTVPAVPTVL